MLIFKTTLCVYKSCAFTKKNLENISHRLNLNSLRKENNLRTLNQFFEFEETDWALCWIKDLKGSEKLNEKCWLKLFWREERKDSAKVKLWEFYECINNFVSTKYVENMERFRGDVCQSGMLNHIEDEGTFLQTFQIVCYDNVCHLCLATSRKLDQHFASS